MKFYQMNIYANEQMLNAIEQCAIYNDIAYCYNDNNISFMSIAFSQIIAILDFAKYLSIDKIEISAM